MGWTLGVIVILSRTGHQISCSVGQFGHEDSLKPVALLLGACYSACKAALEKLIYLLSKVVALPEGRQKKLESQRQCLTKKEVSLLEIWTWTRRKHE